MDCRHIHCSGVKFWNPCAVAQGLVGGVLLISVGLLLGITALWGTEAFCPPPGQYGSRLFLTKKESLDADTLWCYQGVGDGGARAWPGGTFSSLAPSPRSLTVSYTKSHWLQPGAVAEEVVERWWSCNEDGVSPHSLPSLQRSGGAGCLAPHMVHIYNLLFHHWGHWCILSRTWHSPVHRDATHVPAQQGMRRETGSMHHMGRKGLLYGDKLDIGKMIKCRLHVEKLVNKLDKCK